MWAGRLEKLKKAKLHHEELAYMIPVANELVMNAAKRLHEAITGYEDRPHLRYHRHELADAKWYYEQVNLLWRQSTPTPPRRNPILRMPMVVVDKPKKGAAIPTTPKPGMPPKTIKPKPIRDHYRD